MDESVIVGYTSAVVHPLAAPARLLLERKNLRQETMELTSLARNQTLPTSTMGESSEHNEREDSYSNQDIDYPDPPQCPLQETYRQLCRYIDQMIADGAISTRGLEAGCGEIWGAAV